MPGLWRKSKSEPCYSARVDRTLSAAWQSSSEQARRIIAAAFDEGKCEVDLSGLGLQQLPQEIRDLQHFRSINQPLGKFTSSATTSNDLQLFLGNNQLTQLPSILFELRNLSVLSLRTNLLTEVPQDIGRLEALQELQLSGNQIQWLPVEIKRLPRLRTLSISPHALAKAHTATAKGPMSLKETAARTILRASGLSGLRGDDVPLDLHHILKSHGTCSECQGPFLDQYSRLLFWEEVAGVMVPLAHHLCSEPCCAVVRSRMHASAPQAA